jgi:hypothetical protein
MFNGQSSMVNRQWSIVNVQWSIIRGQKKMEAKIRLGNKNK